MNSSLPCIPGIRVSQRSRWSAHACPVHFSFTFAKAAALLILGASVFGYGQDSDKTATKTGKPIPQTHILNRSSVRPGTKSVFARPRLQTSPHSNLTPVNTGTGVVFTCDPNVATTTCSYLNSTVAANLNGTFTNANAQIYVQYGATGLGSSTQYQNFITYNQYVGALSANSNKSAIQTTALSSLNTYDAGTYGTGSVEVTSALGTNLGFSGMNGIVAPVPMSGFASCSPGTSGCYNVIVTVTNDPGITLYYDDQGGTEPADAYDFYSVVGHEANEALGTSSCVSTQGTTGNGLTNGCGAGTPSAVDLFRFSGAGTLASVSAPSTTPGQYFSYDGGNTNPLEGVGGSPLFYNTVANGDDYADYVSSDPCQANYAIQDAEGCPGFDQGRSILNDGGSEIIMLNALGYDVPASGTPAVQLSATSLSFLSRNTGTSSASKTVMLTNSGTATLSISSITLVGTNASSFVFLNTCGSSLAAGANCTIHGHFAPRATGALTASIQIVDNASGSPQSIALSGTGTGGGLVLSSASLSYGTVAVGKSSASKSVTLTNYGSATVSISSIVVAGANPSSFVFLNTCGSTLAAGASCSIHGHLAPKATGPLTASVVITDDATGSPQSIALSGTGN